MHFSRKLAALAATMLILPAAAFAATPKAGTFESPKGKIQNGYDFQFKVKGKKITDLVAHVLEYCDGSMYSSQTTLGPDLAWKIKGGKFKGRKKETYDGITVYTTLRGRFTSQSTAKGIVRQESIVAGSVCDTRELKFTAKR